MAGCSQLVAIVRLVSLSAWMHLKLNPRYLSLSSDKIECITTSVRDQLLHSLRTYNPLHPQHIPFRKQRPDGASTSSNFAPRSSQAQEPHNFRPEYWILGNAVKHNPLHAFQLISPKMMRTF